VKKLAADDMKIEEEVIAKFLAGEATPEEAIALMDWRAMSPENEETFLYFETAWQGNTIDWQEEKAKAWTTIRRATAPARPMIPVVFRWAAVFVLVAAGGTWLYNSLSKDARVADERIVRTTEKPAGTSFSDGSQITLNKNSEVRYPVAFTAASRQVKLRGEAFFDVTPDKTRPFVITCDEVSVKVLGTSFQVSDRAVSKITVQVRTGTVIMFTSEKSIVVEAGWSGIYDKPTHTFALVKPATYNNLGYATHSFEFNQAELSDVLHDVQEAYGVTFVFENERLKHCRLTSQFREQPLNFVLRVISESLSIQCRTEGNTVYISGDGCQ
jgi:ferric-dicitrate binding protein FerR (iron transport regulator)